MKATSVVVYKVTGAQTTASILLSLFVFAIDHQVESISWALQASCLFVCLFAITQAISTVEMTLFLRVPQPLSEHLYIEGYD